MAATALLRESVCREAKQEVAQWSTEQQSVEAVPAETSEHELKDER